MQVFFVVLIVSLISFIHFLLGHSIEVIEEWIFDNGWTIIISGKVISLILLFKFYNLKRNEKYRWKEKIWSHFTSVNKETLLVLLFFLFLAIFFGFNENKSYVFDVFKLIISYFFGLLFYFLDVFFLMFLSKDQMEKGNWLYYLLFSLTFAIFSKLSFLLVTINSSTSKPNLIVTFFNMVILLFLLDLSRPKPSNLTNPLLFLIFFICPMMAVFSWDPIWGGTYSFFESGALFDGKTYLVVSIFILYYLNLKNLNFSKNLFKKG